jgi:hypothetical protein
MTAIVYLPFSRRKGTGSKRRENSFAKLSHHHQDRRRKGTNRRAVLSLGLGFGEGHVDSAVAAGEGGRAALSFAVYYGMNHAPPPGVERG